jgi:ABC-type transporter Mla subunit MlaD
MKTSRNAIAVGILTVMILSGLYIAIQFVSDSMGSAGQYRVFAVFPDASGLHEKSHVRIAGLKVGYIDSIKLKKYKKKVTDEQTGKVTEKELMGARVDFLIASDVVLYENAEALRAADSLLGDQLVVIHPGDATVPEL